MPACRDTEHARSIYKRRPDPGWILLWISLWILWILLIGMSPAERESRLSGKVESRVWVTIFLLLISFPQNVARPGA